MFLLLESRFQPSYCPLGYPVLMLPMLKILPEIDSVLAPFRTNQTIGVLLILTTFSFHVYLAMPWTGGTCAHFSDRPSSFIWSDYDVVRSLPIFSDGQNPLVVNE
jgi:hypothetical protein